MRPRETKHMCNSQGSARMTNVSIHQYTGCEVLGRDESNLLPPKGSHVVNGRKKNNPTFTGEILYHVPQRSDVVRVA